MFWQGKEERVFFELKEPFRERIFFSNNTNSFHFWKVRLVCVEILWVCFFQKFYHLEFAKKLSFSWHFILYWKWASFSCMTFQGTELYSEVHIQGMQIFKWVQVCKMFNFLSYIFGVIYLFEWTLTFSKLAMWSALRFVHNLEDSTKTTYIFHIWFLLLLTSYIGVLHLLWKIDHHYYQLKQMFIFH